LSKSYWQLHEKEWTRRIGAIIELIPAFITSSVRSLSENNFVNMGETFFMVHEICIFIFHDLERNFLIFVKRDLTPLFIPSLMTAPKQLAISWAFISGCSQTQRHILLM